MVAVPRSNSRAIRLLVTLFPHTKYISYSDGLGDSVHEFFMEGAPNYLGHTGFSNLTSRPLLHEIPIVECIEPWGNYVAYNSAGPVLVIAKTPKETSFDAAHLIRLYSRTIAVIAKHRPVLVTGTLPGLEFPRGMSVRTIGSLMSLTVPLELSAAIGLPSTAFLTLSTRLPRSAMRIMRMACARKHPDANRRVNAMKDALERGIDRLCDCGAAVDVRSNARVDRTF